MLSRNVNAIMNNSDCGAQGGRCRGSQNDTTSHALREMLPVTAGGQGRRRQGSTSGALHDCLSLWIEMRKNGMEFLRQAGQNGVMQLCKVGASWA